MIMATTLDLFGDDDTAQSGREAIGPQSFVLRGFALPFAEALLQGVDTVAAPVSYTHLTLPTTPYV